MTGIYWWINIGEAALWAAMGVVVLARSFMRGSRQFRPTRWASLLAAATLFAFALSDVIESQTGAWWRPWWLLVWKGTCVLVLAGVVATWVVRARRFRADVPHKLARDGGDIHFLGGAGSERSS